MRTKFLSVLALTAILFASCSNDDSIDEANDGRVQFTSGVNAPTLRVGGANGNQWEGNESIGIFMRNNATGKAIQSANVKYTTTSVGASAVFASATPLYYPVNAPAKVDFVAYHPYATLSGDYGYSVDVANQSSPSAIDLMVATADNNTAGYDKSSTSAVNLVFDHQLVKVQINVLAGEGVNSLSGLAVKIKGMNTKAEFDIATAILSNEDTPADITPKDAGSNVYEAILLPVALANETIEFTVGGNTYVWKINNVANSNNITSLDKGKVYTFNVTIQETSVQVTGTINAWQPAGTVNGTAS